MAALKTKTFIDNPDYEPFPMRPKIVASVIIDTNMVLLLTSGASSWGPHVVLKKLGVGVGNGAGQQHGSRSGLSETPRLRTSVVAENVLEWLRDTAR